MVVVGDACDGSVACDPLDLIIGPLVLNELCDQMVPERVARDELVYPCLIGEPLGPPLKGGF
jgi:hypothetical protein